MAAGGFAVCTVQVHVSARRPSLLRSWVKIRTQRAAPEHGPAVAALVSLGDPHRLLWELLAGGTWAAVPRAGSASHLGARGFGNDPLRVR